MLLSCDISKIGYILERGQSVVLCYLWIPTPQISLVDLEPELVQPARTCAECGREFITTSAYKLHMRKFHSVIITDEDINSVAAFSGHDWEKKY